MAFPHFLTRSVDRLAPDGSLSSTDLRLPALGPALVLIDRERCRFEGFRPPPGLGGGALMAAARLHAETRSPYETAQSVVTRRGADFGIWWWDREWADAALDRHGVSTRVRLLPETLLQPEGEGWRVVRGSSGHEAQLWLQGLLIASQWRRRPFDEQSWAAFVRVQTTDIPAPAGPPNALQLPYAGDSAYRRRLVALRARGDLAPLALSAAAALLLCAGALFTGQGLKLGQQSQALERELAGARAVSQVSLRPRLYREANQLAQLRTLTAGPDPLTLVQHAQEILAPFKLKVGAFTASSREVSVIVAAEAVAGIDILTEELEASPYFTNVRPSLDRQKRQLTLTMAVRQRP